jgi:lipopolysaccharide biosynthesis regulator YciM
VLLLLLIHRQACNVNKAKTDFETVLSIKPEHKTAIKELELLNELQQHMGTLEQLQSADPDAAKGAVNKVLQSAPDCVAAQLAEAQLEVQQGNWEQVGD